MREQAPIMSMELGRRGLLAAGAASLIAACAPRASAKRTYFQRIGQPIGVQLYSVGAQLTGDLDGTLGQVAKIGYKTVELAGYAGKTPAEFRAALDRAGLKCTSSHVQAKLLRPSPTPVLTLMDPAEKIAEEAHLLGFDTVIMPLFIIPDRFSLVPGPGETFASMVAKITQGMNEDDWKRNAEFMNQRGAAFKKLGLRFGYHNHGTEFAPIQGGRSAMDLLFAETDPHLVEFELDVGWTVSTGTDPAAFIAKHAKRITALHVKDVAPTTKPNFLLQQDPVEIGQGIVDWKKLLTTAGAAGIKRYFVEQEAPYVHPPLESLKISFDYLNAVVA